MVGEVGGGGEDAGTFGHTPGGGAEDNDVGWGENRESGDREDTENKRVGREH